MKKFSYQVILQQQVKELPSGENPFETYKEYVSVTVHSFSKELERNKTELIQKNGSILRGGLTHFLSTPLKSDKDDIIRLIEDTIEQTVQQLDAVPLLSSVEHSLWKVMESQEVPLQRQMVGVVKRLLKNGRTLLTEAGCTFGKNTGDAAVSLFTFDGFSTVQSLTSVIEGFPLQQHLTVVNGLFHKMITSIDQQSLPEKNLVLIDFDYDDNSIVDAVNNRLPVLQDQFGITDFTLSKQSLHSSASAAFQIRIGMNVHKIPLGSVILSLIGDHEEFENAVTNHGSVIVLEQFVSP